MKPKIINTLPVTDPEFIRDPYPKLLELRGTTPIFWDESLERYVFLRYADIAALLRDKRLGRGYDHLLSRDELGFPPPDPRQAAFDAFNNSHMLDREPPDHTRLRALVSQVFTPRRVEEMLPRIAAIISQTLEGVVATLEATGRFDFVADFAEPLPVTVIAELLGIPLEGRVHLRPWSAAIVKLYEPTATALQQSQANTAVLEFSNYLLELAEMRKVQPQNDLISALLTAREGTDQLSEQEFISTCILLLNAGHEASVNGSSAGMLALCHHPEQQAKLERAAQNSHTSPQTLPPLFRSAIEEFLRFDTPLPMFERWVLHDFEYVSQHGTLELKRGDKLALLYASGNRDPEMFAQPDVLDLERNQGLHLSFGLGIHYCLGAPLARLEMGMAFKMLLERLPGLRVVQNHPKLEYGGFVIRGLKALWLEL